MKNKVLAFSRDPDAYREKLAKLSLPDLEIVVVENEADIEAHIADANIILGIPWMIKPHLEKAKNLAWLQSSFAGIDAFLEEGVKSDFLLTNVKDTYGRVMAEYVLAYVLHFEREIAENMAFQKEKIWQQRESKTLEGKKICIMGTGSIGKRIAKAMKFFGCVIYGYRTEDAMVEGFDRIFTPDNFEAFLTEADYLVNVLPLNKDTFEIINRDTLALMKPSTVFINIGRGPSVQEDDLAEAIRKRRIAAAVLDVFKEEPLPKESPLWGLENVYITPHVSGYIVSDRIFEIFEKNYQNFLEGKELMYLVDRKRGY